MELLTTLTNALRELLALGFLGIARRGGGVESGKRMCHLYRFTDLPTLEFPKLLIEAVPATNEFLRFETIAQAEKALKDWVDEAKREASDRNKVAQLKAQRKNSSLQKMERNAPENGPIDHDHRSRNWSHVSGNAPENGAMNFEENSRKTAPDVALR